ncbi:MAG: RNA methyltransferase [Cytophagales bacterium]|nr:RNA methyltransferase [Cytophagales bacterium]
MDQYSHDLLDFLSQYVSSGKKRAMDKVLDFRTRYLTVVLEDIYQPQNASAVIRSCDCFGIQDLHVIENKHHYAVNPRVVHGASKWVDIFHYKESHRNSENCFEHLKNAGYRLVGTLPSPEAQSIYDLEIDEPLALVFGTEKYGISTVAKKYCDSFVTIPMYGFTESFNVSVSAALAINILSTKLFSSKQDWQLSGEDRLQLKLKWSKKVVARSEILEKEFLRSGKYFS